MYLVEAAEGRHVLGIQNKIKDAEVLHYPVPLGALRDHNHPELDQISEYDLSRGFRPPLRHAQHRRVLEEVVHHGVLAGAEGARVLSPPCGPEARVGHHPDAELVHGRPQLPLLEVGRALHLVDRDWNPGRVVESLDLLAVEVGHPDALEFALVDQPLHLPPNANVIHFFFQDGLKNARGYCDAAPNIGYMVHPEFSI